MLQNREPDKPIQLIGRSMGVLIATQLAMQCENFVSLILAEPMIFCVLNPLEDADAIAADSQSIVGLSEDDEDGIARFISFWNGTEWMQLPEGANTAIIRLREQVTNDALQVSTVTIDAAKLAEIQCPVQILRGTQTNTAAARICRRLDE